MSICMFQAPPPTDNVIPQRTRGCVHRLQPQEECATCCSSGSAKSPTGRQRLLRRAARKNHYHRGYPVLVNRHERETSFPPAVAREIVGDTKVNTDVAPVMGAEDFSLNARSPARFHLRRQRRQRGPLSPGL